MSENSIGWVLTKERLPEKDGEYFCITRIPQKDPNNEAWLDGVPTYEVKRGLSNET